MATGERQIAIHVFPEYRIDVPTLSILSGGGLSLDEAGSHLESMTYITRCDSEVAPMESSRRPMHFTLRDSKGARRLFMVKQEIPPEGNGVDYEQQMMKLVRLMNQLFAKDRRRVRLVEFVIIMVSDNCGLYEWLDGTGTLAHLVKERAERTVPPLTDVGFREPCQGARRLHGA
jgi:phosphatidylinositol kinase/protein kinase (PI-3  family)